MGPKGFLIRIIIFSVFMVAYVFGFPSILSLIQSETPCGKFAGLCPYLTGLWQLFHPQIAAIIFAIVVAKMSYERCLNAQITPLWVLPLILWTLGSSTFLIGFRNYWGSWVNSFAQSFGAGFLSFHPPLSLIFLLAILFFLAFYQDSDQSVSDLQSIRTAWMLVWIAGGLGTIMKLHLIAMAFPIFPVIGLPISMVMTKIGLFLVYYVLGFIPGLYIVLNWILPVVFCTALSYLVFQSRLALVSNGSGLEFRE